MFNRPKLHCCAAVLLCCCAVVLLDPDIPSSDLVASSHVSYHPDVSAMEQLIDDGTLRYDSIDLGWDGLAWHGMTPSCPLVETCNYNSERRRDPHHLYTYFIASGRGGLACMPRRKSSKKRRGY